MSRISEFITRPIYTPEEIKERLDHGGMIVCVTSIALGIVLWSAYAIIAKYHPAFLTQFTMGQRFIYAVGGFVAFPTLGYTLLALRYLNDKRRLRQEGL